MLTKETKLTKVTKHWYTVFQLRANPFSSLEASLEQYSDEIGPLETSMDPRVKAFISAKTSCLIRGERGIGKTSLIQSVHSAMAEEEKEKLYIILTPKDFLDLNSQLYLQFPEEEMVKVIRLHCGSTCWKCADMKTGRCKLCSLNCKMQVGSQTPESAYYTLLRLVKDPCRAKQIMVSRLLAYRVRNRTFLIDAPDNLSGQEAREFVGFISLLLRNGNQPIIFVTPQQAMLLEKFDTLARFPAFDFETPTMDFFRALFKQRIEAYQTEKAPSPFKDEVIEKIAIASGFNPRNFLRTCGFVLTEMWLRKMEAPCDLEFLKTINLNSTAKSSFDEQEALKEIMLESTRQGIQWVKVKQIKARIHGRYGVDMDPKRLGRRLSELGYVKRYNPDAEYRVII